MSASSRMRVRLRAVVAPALGQPLHRGPRPSSAARSPRSAGLVLIRSSSRRRSVRSHWTMQKVRIRDFAWSRRCSHGRETAGSWRSRSTAPAARPLFLQIAGSLADDIRRGRLRPGQPLPGTRRLAATLGVNRNTVVAAYDELAGRGLDRDRRARGPAASRRPCPTRGRSASPRRRPARCGARTHRATTCPRCRDSAPSGTRPHAELVFGSGVPDLRLVPVAALARAYRRALRQPRPRAARLRGHPRAAPPARGARRDARRHPRPGRGRRTTS